MLICKKRILFIIIFFIFFGVNNLKADLFSYTVHVSSKASNFNLARNKFIQYNRELSLEKVIEKIISFENFKKVEMLVDESSANFYEDRMILTNEVISGNYYSVDITYYFNKNKIIDFLKKNEIPYTLKLENKVLFIPIYNNKISKENEWYALWQNISKKDYLTDIVLLEDNGYDAKKILKEDKKYLETLKTKYNVDDVMISKLEEIDIIDETADNKEETDEDEIEQDNSKTYNLTLNSLTYFVSKEYDDIKFIYDALSLSIAFSEDSKKELELFSISKKDEIMFKVTFNNFVEWVTIYNYLKQIDQIENINITEIYLDYVILKIKYHGDINNIINQAKMNRIYIDTNELIIKCQGFCY